ncbi:MAG: hypothetical protein KA248_01910 [Kiritimatiellae bacterium]|nr:hypothetical protein [Kiritimatiellia bacterium]
MKARDQLLYSVFVAVLFAAVAAADEAAILGFGAAGTNLSVFFRGNAGERYHVQQCDDLAEGRWRSPCSVRLPAATGEVRCARHGEQSAMFRLRENPVPTNHRARYDDIEEGLAVFAPILEGLPAQTDAPQTLFGLPAMVPNGNRGYAVLSATNRARMLAEVDLYHTMGAELLKLDITYPLLTRAFHEQLALQPGYEWYAGVHEEDYLAVYTAVVQRARDRGMRVLVEHSLLIPSYSVTDPGFYFDTIRGLGEQAGRLRVQAELASEGALIQERLAPDWFSLVVEPESQNQRFGEFPGGAPLMNPTQWTAHAEAVVTALRAQFPGAATRFGAGQGTWENPAYTENFVEIAGLDYVDFHVFPVRSAEGHYLTNLVGWCAAARAAGKGVTLGEAWLYKADREDLASAGMDFQDIYARDLYSFWEPLDVVFMRQLAGLALKENAEFLCFFWPTYQFRYWSYPDDFELAPGGTPDDLAPMDRLTMADRALRDVIASGAVYRTEAGLEFRRLAGAAP